MRIINNSVHLAGVLSESPELRTLTDGTYVANFRLRTYHTSAEGQESGSSTHQYFNLTAWRGMAREMNRYFKKGSHLMVRGELRNRLYTVAGNRSYRTEIHVHEFLSLARPEHNAASPSLKRNLCV